MPLHAEKNFKCHDCGNKKTVASEKPSSTLYNMPNCCGKQMYVAS